MSLCTSTAGWKLLFPPTSPSQVLGLGQVKHSQALLWLLYAVAFGVLRVGEELLDRAIERNQGPGIYNMKMIVAFAYIYNLIVNAQIRVIVMNFSEPHRTIGLWAHPLILCLLRLLRTQFSSLKTESTSLAGLGEAVRNDVRKAGQEANTTGVESAKKAANALTEHEEDHLLVRLLKLGLFMFIGGGKRSLIGSGNGPSSTGDAETAAPQGEDEVTKQNRVRLALTFQSMSTKISRQMLTTVVKMLAANIAVFNAVSVACLLNSKGDESSFRSLGTCSENGYVLELIFCTVPFFLIDLVEMVIYVYHYKLPLYVTFFQLDAFLVLAVVLVNYMSFLLLALAA